MKNPRSRIARPGGYEVAGTGFYSGDTIPVMVNWDCWVSKSCHQKTGEKRGSERTYKPGFVRPPD